MTLTCTKCKETKPISEFHKARNRKSGHHTWCKSCVKVNSKKRYDSEEHYEKRKEWRRKNRFVYALTFSRAHAKKRGYVPCSATPEELKAAFTGKCGLCGCPEVECNTQLHMDHCHETGELRGFLCARCNMGIGYFKNSEELLIDALHYLMNTKRKVT